MSSTGVVEAREATPSSSATQHRRPVPLIVGAGYDIAGRTWTPARVKRLRFLTAWLDSEAS
jgi:hypothetical protein